MTPNSNDRSADDQERERDEILKRLLKMPPQPRPHRERDEKPKPKSRSKPTKKNPGQ